MSHAMQGHPRWTIHSGEFWQNVIYWRRKWQTTPVYLPWETHELYKKAKKKKKKKNIILQGCDEAQCNTLYICRKELASRYFYSHVFVANNLSPSEKQIGYLSWTLGKYIFLLTFWPQDWMWRVNVNFFLLLTEKKRFFSLMNRISIELKMFQRTKK